jgi:CRISPR-associated protein Csm3
MRSLSEWYHDELPTDGNPTRPQEGSRTARVFGVSASRDREVGPTRLIVRDAFLSSACRDSFKQGHPLTEVKHENSINRLTAMANPRPMERVLPGVAFDFELAYRILDTGDDGATDEENFKKVVLPALALVQADYLGSAGSRGCGQVRFTNLKDENGKDIELPSILDPKEAKAG